jgi:hypothetical protein
MTQDNSWQGGLLERVPVAVEIAQPPRAGFLAGYRGLIREACTLDLRQFTGWCRTRFLPLFSVRWTDIETFSQELEGRSRQT